MTCLGDSQRPRLAASIRRVSLHSIPLLPKPPADHGKGALARPAAPKAAAGGKAVTGAGSQTLKQPQPSALARERVAPYSTRRQRQRQEEEKERLSPLGYEPVRGGKRKKARGGMGGGAAGGMENDAGFAPMMMAYPPQSMQQPGQGQGQGQQGGKGKASTALATAQAIINSAAPHPKKGEIAQVRLLVYTCLALLALYYPY